MWQHLQLHLEPPHALLELTLLFRLLLARRMVSSNRLCHVPYVGCATLAQMGEWLIVMLDTRAQRWVDSPLCPNHTVRTPASCLLTSPNVPSYARAFCACVRPPTTLCSVPTVLAGRGAATPDFARGTCQPETCRGAGTDRKPRIRSLPGLRGRDKPLPPLISYSCEC